MTSPSSLSSAKKSKRIAYRRTAVLAIFLVLMVVVFIVRLFDIQVVSAQDHVEDAQNLGLGGSQSLYGARGAIVDMNGQILADSVVYYDCQLDPANIADFERRNDDGDRVSINFEQAAQELSVPTGKSAEEIRSIADRALEANPNTHFAYLAQKLNTEQFRAVAELRIPYVACISHPARSYPDGAVAGNILGFVRDDGDPLAGVELFQNQCLQAEDGIRRFIRGTSGEIIPGTQEDEPAVDGGQLTLTIDRDLQWYLQQLIAEQVQELGALSGSITVAEVSTGKIRAIAEYPTVDPNNFYAAAEEDRGSRVFTQTFEPGSTFKSLNAAMIIDAGGVKVDDVVSADYLEFFPNGARVRDMFTHPVYNYTLTGSLIDSSNVATAKFAEKLDTKTRYEYFKKFGISASSEIDFGQQAAGILHKAEDWDNQTLYNVSFGQGVTTTVLELVGAYQAIANGGMRVPLSLIESCERSDGTVTAPKTSNPERVISEQTAASVTTMLENVVTQGSLRNFGIDGYRYAAKTGTAEKVDPNTGRYKDNAFVTTIIGYAPAEAPQYVVSVTLDEPKKVTTSHANSEPFQVAMTQVLKTFRVLPSNSEAPVLSRFAE